MLEASVAQCENSSAFSFADAFAAFVMFQARAFGCSPNALLHRASAVDGSGHRAACRARGMHP
jgi:hypothetical protein